MRRNTEKLAENTEKLVEKLTENTERLAEKTFDISAKMHVVREIQ